MLHVKRSFFAKKALCGILGFREFTANSQCCFYRIGSHGRSLLRSGEGNCCSSAPPFEQRLIMEITISSIAISCIVSFYHFLLDHLAKESPGSRLQRHPKPWV